MLGFNYSYFHYTLSHKSLWIEKVDFYKNLNLVLKLVFCTIETFLVQICT